MALPDTYRRELRTYVTGLLLALLLTVIPFAAVEWKLFPAFWILVVVFALGFLQLLVHFSCFLHIGARSHRDDLNLLLFSTLIVLLMVGGTLIILFNLHQRMVSGL
jgi:cytochrome o ubiquinol oxidase subunit IV